MADERTPRARGPVPPDPGTITGSGFQPLPPDDPTTRAGGPPDLTHADPGATPPAPGLGKTVIQAGEPPAPTNLVAPPSPADPATATVAPASPVSAAAESASPATSAAQYQSDARESNRSREKSHAWGTLPANDQFEPGNTVFDRYTVVRKLGAGGMGSVWLVRHLTLDAPRALKIIVARIAEDSRARGRFRREAVAMARFSHPNAVVVHDAVLTRDVAFIEMEYIEGSSLDKVFRRGQPLSVERVGLILRQLCAVLEVAHAQGIVHRDLKPSNLMLVGPPGGPQDTLKVLDFGIAKIIGQGDEVHTLPNEFLGTPPYTSPEQASGVSDARSDIYSLGVILFELLTGYRPFRGPVAQQIADTINKPPPPFREANAQVDLPEALERLVLRCLAKKPEDRPQTVREVWEAFEAAAPPGTLAKVGGLPPPPGWQVRRFDWRSKRVLGTLGALGIAAVVAGGVYWNSGRREPSGVDRQPDPVARTPEPKSAPTPLPKGYEPAGEAAAPLARLRFAPTGTSLLRIEGGRFTMGGFGPPGDDRPPAPHEEEVPTYYLGATEVTNGEFRAYLRATGADAPPKWDDAYRKLLQRLTSAGETNPEAVADRHPAVGVTHEAAAAFAAWAHGRLPTAAEWEYAARSLGKPGRVFVWDSKVAPEPDTDLAQIDAVSKPGLPTRPVGSFPQDRTEQGLVDLTGNVREWTADRDLRAASPGGKPAFVVRGGSWSSDSARFATTVGTPVAEDEALPDLGFRLALDPPS